MLRLISLCLLAAAVSPAPCGLPCQQDVLATTQAPCFRDAPTQAPCQQDVPTTVAPCQLDVTTPAPCVTPCVNDQRTLPCYQVQHDEEMPAPVDWTLHDQERLKGPCRQADVPLCPQADVPRCGCPQADPVTLPPCAIQADATTIAPCLQADPLPPCGCPQADAPVLPPCQATLPPCPQADASALDIKCDNGWVRYDTSCYFVVSDHPTGFKEAEDKCAAMGASLVTVNSREEFDAILQKEGPLNTLTWIGMKKAEEDAYPIYQAKTELDYKDLPWLISDASYAPNGWSAYAQCAASFNPSSSVGKYVYWYPCNYNFNYICEKNSILAANDIAHIY